MATIHVARPCQWTNITQVRWVIYICYPLEPEQEIQGGKLSRTYGSLVGGRAQLIIHTKEIKRRKQHYLAELAKISVGDMHGMFELIRGPYPYFFPLLLRMLIKRQPT